MITFCNGGFHDRRNRRVGRGVGLMAGDVYIYGLAHPATGVVRYVGKCTGSPNGRLRCHKYKALSGRTKTRLGVWLRRLFERRLTPAVIVLQPVLDEMWQRAERYWIARLRTEGRKLLNMNDGGNGAHTRVNLPESTIRLMGRVSDARIAERVGLSREAIKYHRNRLGISRAYDSSRRRGMFVAGMCPHNKIGVPRSIDTLIGKKSDAALAAQMGVSRIVIRRRRRELGLAPLARKKVVR